MCLIVLKRNALFVSYFYESARQSLCLRFYSVWWRASAEAKSSGYHMYCERSTITITIAIYWMLGVSWLLLSTRYLDSEIGTSFTTHRLPLALIFRSLDLSQRYSLQFKCKISVGYLERPKSFTIRGVQLI